MEATTFFPHGHCYVWQPTMVWLQVTSNGVIAGSYVAISGTLAYIVHRLRGVLPFSWLYLCFGAFIVLCGVTHMLDVWTIWRANYYFDAAVRMLTAAVSAGTALLLWRVTPQALTLARGTRALVDRGVPLESADTYLQTRELLHRAIEAAPVGILVIDGHGKIVQANQPSATLLGSDREQVVGETVESFVPLRLREGEHRALRERYMRDPAARAMGAGRDLRAVRRDGTEVPVEIGLSPLSIGDQQLVVASVVDVSARKAAEDAVKEAYAALEHTVELRTAALQRSNEDLERFASIAAHDLQEPLRMVASYTRLLADDYRGRLDADADEYIRFAVDGATRMQRLLNDLLAYSRVSSKAESAADIDADQALDEALANLELPIRESGATLVRERLPRIRADRSQVTQLFQNLIGNAIKFAGGEPPRIEVSAAAEDPQHARFSVKDHGIGFDMKHAERVFAIFQRLHPVGGIEGSGIGLAIVKRIVDRHGGRIWAESELGAGATFHFTLPTPPSAP